MVEQLEEWDLVLSPTSHSCTRLQGLLCTQEPSFQFLLLHLERLFLWSTPHTENKTISVILTFAQTVQVLIKEAISLKVPYLSLSESSFWDFMRDSAFENIGPSGKSYIFYVKDWSLWLFTMILFTWTSLINNLTSSSPWLSIFVLKRIASPETYADLSSSVLEK